MRTALLMIGILTALAGLIWAAQGSGYFPYPRSSFMVDQTRWIYIGLVTAALGVVVIFVSRRF
jgi:hypothetical protein